MNDNVILINILKNSGYYSKLNSKVNEYDFRSFEVQKIYHTIEDMFNKYNKVPSIDELKTYISTNDKEKAETNEKLIAHIEKKIEGKKSDIDDEVLVDSTTKYIKNSRFEKLLERGILLLEGNSKETLSSIQDDMEKVLEFGFDNRMGHDYFEDAVRRFEWYSKIDEDLVESGIDMVDSVCGGKGTLTVFLAQSNVGKSLHLASWATNASLQCKNVALFTMEDGEHPYASRIDANLMNTTLEEMKEKGLAMKTAFKSVIGEGLGRIKIKEYATGSATVNDFKKALKDWKLKDGFTPDIIFVDYLGIMTTRNTFASGYEKGGSVAEEVRSLAQEYDVQIVSAVQARRDLSGEALDLNDVADSIKIMQTVDAGIGIMQDPEDANKQLLIPLKSRRLNKNKIKPRYVNVNTSHQRVWDLEENLDYRKMKKKTKELVKSTIDNMDTIVEASEDPDEDLLARIMV